MASTSDPLQKLLDRSKQQKQTQQQTQGSSVQQKVYSNPYDTSGRFWEPPNTVSPDALQNMLEGKTKFASNQNYYVHEDINDITHRIQDAGLDVPIPSAYKKADDRKKGFLSQITDPLNFLQYGLAHGLKNVADDDKDTKFWEGAKKGMASAFDPKGKRLEDRTSFREVINALGESDKTSKQALYTALTWFPVLASRVKGKLKLGDNATPEQLQAMMSDPEHFEAAESITGFAGDLFLDPGKYIGGVADGLKLMTKGSKALDSADDIAQGVSKAKDILNKAGKVPDDASAEYLFRKAAKQLGKMNDYKGLTFAGQTIIKPEWIAKFGDVTGLSKLGDAAGAGIDALKASKLGQDISNMFFTENYNILKDSIGKFPDQDTTMKMVLQSDNIPRMKFKTAQKVDDWFNKAKKFQDAVGDTATEKWMTSIGEAQGETTNVYKVVDVLTPNKEYQDALIKAKKYTKSQITKNEKLLVDLQAQIKAAQNSGNAGEVADLVVSYTHLMKMADEAPVVSSLEFARHLIANGIDEKTLSSIASEVINPMEFATMGIDDVVKKLNINEELAAKIKLAAEHTINSIGELFPEYAANYMGTKKIDVVDMLFNLSDDKSKHLYTVDEYITNTAKQIGREIPDLESMTMAQKIDLSNSLRKAQQGTKKASEKQVSYVKRLLTDITDPTASKEARTLLKDLDSSVNSMTNGQAQTLIPQLEKLRDTQSLSSAVDNIDGFDPLRNIDHDAKQIASAKSVLSNKRVYKGSKQADDIEAWERAFKTKGIDTKEYDLGVLDKIYSPEGAQYNEVVDALREYGALGKQYGVYPMRGKDTMGEYIDKLNQLDNQRKIAVADLFPFDKLKEDEELFSEANSYVNKLLNIVERESNSKAKVDPKKLDDFLNDILKFDGDDGGTPLDKLAPPPEEAPEVFNELVSGFDLDYANKKITPIPSENSVKNMHEFMVGGRTIRVSDDANPEYVKKVLGALESSDPKLDKVISSTDLTITRNGVVTHNGDKLSLGTRGFFIEDKGVMVLDNALSNADTTEHVKNMLVHEHGHALGSAMGKLHESINSDIQGMVSGLSDEQLTAVVDAIRSAPSSNFQKLDADMLKKGFVSSYPHNIFKDGDVERAARENLAEFVSLVFNDDKNISKVIEDNFPDATKSIYNALANMERKDLDKFIPQNIVGTKDEIARKLDNLYNSTEYMKGQMSDLKEIDTLNRRIDRTKERLTEYYKRSTDDKALNEWFKKHSGKDIPEFTKTEDVVVDYVINKHPMDEMEPYLRDMLKAIKDDFKEMGIKEGLFTEENAEQMSAYMFHMLNPDLGKTKKGRTILKQYGINVDADIPFNIHSMERNLRGTIDEINKWAKTELGVDEFFETQLSRIYLKRAINHENFMFEKDLYESTINTFGEKILNADELKSKGIEDFSDYYKDIKSKIRSGDYVVLSKDPRWVKESAKVLGEDAIDTAKSVAHDNAQTIKGVKDKIGKYSKRAASDEDIQEFLSVALKDTFKTADISSIPVEEIYRMSGADTFLVKKPAYDLYNAAMKSQIREQKNALEKVFDNYTNLFKGYATGFNLSFHQQNIVGNIFNSYLSIGSDYFDPVVQAQAVQVLTGKGSLLGKTAQEWKDIVTELQVIDNTIFNEATSEFVQGGVDVLGKLSGKTKAKKVINLINLFSTENIALKAGTEIGSFIENQAKLVNFFSHVNSGKSIQEAADLTNKFLFNYADISQFESRVLKKLFPFYTWMRKNIPLQLEAMLYTPEKYARISKGLRVASDISDRKLTQEEKEIDAAFRPDYLENALPLGDNRYLDLDLPVNDLEKMLSPRDMFSSLHPLPKVLIEALTNHQTYFDSPIRQYEGQMTKAPMYLEPLAEDTPKGKMIDPMTPYVLRNLFPGFERMSNLGEMVRGAYDKEKQDERVDDKAISWMKGNRIKKADLERLQKQAIYDYLNELKNYQKNMKKQGYIKEQNADNPLQKLLNSAR